MTVYCQNCGAEVAEGQRFCRLCGTEVRPAQAGEAPTRIFDGQAQQAAPPFNTSKLQESRTDPVYQARLTAPQPLGAQPTISPLGPAGRPARSRKWIYALVALGILGSIFVTLLIFASQSPLPNQPRIVVRKAGGQPPVPPAPNPGQAGVLPLDESGADVSDDETVIEKSYNLRDGAAISLKNVNGDIKVEGWDEDHAEVRIIKSGGSAEEREAVQITQASTPNKLSLETPQVAHTPVEVRYELMLPHKVAINISSFDSDVKLSEISGAVAVDLQKGSIELREIAGPIKAKTIKGDIRARLDGEARKGPQEFTTVKGDIELHLQGEVNADVKAETVDGKIEADDEFKLQVTKQPVGQHVAGHVGAGGDPLLARTVNGNIKLKK